MLLADLFSYISTLDSSSINIGGDDNGDIASNHYPKVINAINLAMIDLYTEFPVKVRGMTIQLYSHITEYYLDSDYAATNTESTEVYKYITDTANNPFTDDVIHIVTAFNEEGEEFYLNNEEESLSLYTPSYDILQHPYPSSENAVFLTYKALPTKIPTNSDVDTYKVGLPRQLLNLLLVYVNYKLLSSVNKEESMAKLNEYLSLVTKAKTNGLFLSDEAANTKIEDSKWE
jgi:hypothetical protein